MSNFTFLPDQFDGFKQAAQKAPFTSLHAGGPDALFAGKDNVIEGLFDALDNTQPNIQKAA